MKKKSGIIAVVLIVMAIVVFFVCKLSATDDSHGIEFKEPDSGIVEDWENENSEYEEVEKFFEEPILKKEGEPDPHPIVEMENTNKTTSTDDEIDVDESGNKIENNNVENKKEENKIQENKTEDKKEENKTEETPEVSEKPSVSDKEKTEYEKYMEMSGEEQQKVFESYKKPEDFFAWYNAAKAEYDKQNQAVVVEGGSINLEDYIGKMDE